MPVSFVARLFSACSLFLLLTVAATASTPAEEFAKLLPGKVGDARAAGALDLKAKQKAPDFINPLWLNEARSAARSYTGASGEKFDVQLHRMRSDNEAYSLLSATRLAQSARSQGSVRTLGDIGTGAIASPEGVTFYKGATFVFVKSSLPADGDGLVDFARALAKPLDEGSGEIPVLVKHLPDWETAEGRAVYVLAQPALKELVPGQAALDVVSFDAGTEAVTATYEGGARLLIVEYATPQMASEADAAIKARIAALPGEGKPTPTAYRRVGNYAVFVFDAPNEQAAAGLIDKVTYEKDVRWLGENPYAVERANRVWLNMSTSVIVNTVKATGLAIVVCLTLGGVFGGWIFMRRRAQAALTEKFSDAGGMLRLNLDEMGAQNNAARALGQGDKVG
ncbi:MAG TPA: DUF6599 family protein [Pyrinomonadaceae bacterium]|nr:DUF6599 family protein [Pyrinomonadaceae bacterium]